MAATRKADTENIEATVKAGAETASKSYEQAVAFTRDNFRKASGMAFRNYDEAADFSRGNLDALVESSNVVVRGFEDMSRQFASFAQASVEGSITRTKRLFGARSLPEAMDIQAGWAREYLDDAIAHGTKAQEQSMKILTEASAPINARVSAALQKITTPPTNQVQ